MDIPPEAEPSRRFVARRDSFRSAHSVRIPGPIAPSRQISPITVPLRDVKRTGVQAPFWIAAAARHEAWIRVVHLTATDAKPSQVGRGFTGEIGSFKLPRR